jgi:hypothetical protein
MKMKQMFKEHNIMFKVKKEIWKFREKKEYNKICIMLPLG